MVTLAGLYSTNMGLQRVCGIVRGSVIAPILLEPCTRIDSEYSEMREPRAATADQLSHSSQCDGGIESSTDRVLVFFDRDISEASRDGNSTLNRG